MPRLLALFLMSALAGALSVLTTIWAQEKAAAADRPLVVRHYHTMSLSNADADAIFAAMTDVVRNSDGNGDFPANITFTRSGAVAAFNTGDGSIDSSAEFSAVNDLPGNVKVVNEINWCGGPAPTAIGCAPVPGTSLVVERFTGIQEGILWAHEYGHNCGLSHRDEEHAVMRPFIGNTHRRINVAERDAYLMHMPLLAAAAAGAPQPVDGEHESNDNEKPAVPVREFVARIYFHGVPWDEAIKYSKEDVPELLKLLDDKEFAPYKANVVTTLGLIGDERAIAALEKVIASGDGELTQGEYKARKAAVLHLGTLYTNTQDKRLLEFLKQGASSVEFWNDQLDWSAPSGKDTTQRNKQVVTMAIWGLGLTGAEEARETLQSLSGGKGPFEALTDPIVQDALKINEQVKSKGLREYTRMRSHSE